MNLVELSGLGQGSAATVFLLYGGYDISLIQSPASAVQKQWNFVDTVDLSWGRQHLKFGIDYRRLTPVATPPGLAQAYLYLARRGSKLTAASLGRLPLLPRAPVVHELFGFRAG